MSTPMDTLGRMDAYARTQNLTDLLGPCPPGCHIGFVGGPWIGYVPDHKRSSSTSTLDTPAGARNIDVKQVHPMLAPFCINPLVRSTSVPTPPPPPGPTPTPTPSLAANATANAPQTKPKLRILTPPSRAPLPGTCGVKDAVSRLQRDGGNRLGPDAPDPALTALQKSLERLRRHEAAERPYQIDVMVQDVSRTINEFGEGVREAICEGRHNPRTALKGLPAAEVLEITVSGHGLEAADQVIEMIGNNVSEAEHRLLEGDAHDRGRATVELTGDLLAAASTAKLVPGKVVKTITNVVSTVAERLCEATDPTRTLKGEVETAIRAIRSDLVTRPEIVKQIEDEGHSGDISMPKGWRKCDGEGISVYQVDALIDRERVDRLPLSNGKPNPTYGWTNAERMAHGLPPIGTDSQPVRIQQMHSAGQDTFVEVLGGSDSVEEYARDLPLAQESAYWRRR